eukprot:scaffold122546_cov27-Prasinocladus_malaysianus.AAC.1
MTCSGGNSQRHNRFHHLYGLPESHLVRENASFWPAERLRGRPGQQSKGWAVPQPPWGPGDPDHSAPQDVPSS